jgi:tetratricopeptide (TPR) repeat protein
VLDAGVTETGRPYFVMELVEGEPITDFCDRWKMTVRDRLDLFVQACHAVQHAHQKGIIHRDIKPSNALVTQVDGKPMLKVIDFGVAKALYTRPGDKTLTGQRHLIGTLHYMSPEQAEAGVDIDTRSDIYSLGVLLYELLTGTTPFGHEGMPSVVLAEFQRTVREQEPQKPSTRVSSIWRAANKRGTCERVTAGAGDRGAERPGSAERDAPVEAHSRPGTVSPHTSDSASSAREIAARRRSDPGSLCRRVNGDLDWIVMKCLEKDRTRRYDTANGLARDIERHLAGAAVDAVPPSLSYRLSRSFRRHRIGIATAGVITIVLIAGIVVSGWFALREAAARSEIELRRRDTEQVAEFQAAILRDVKAKDAGVRLTQLLLERLDAALAKDGVGDSERAARLDSFRDELRSVGTTDVAVGLIDQTMLTPAREAIARQFADQPIVDASLRQTLADVYENLGKLDAAVALQEEALTTRRRILGEDHPDTISSINSMGVLFVRSGRLEEAEAYYKEAIEKARRVLGEDDEETLRCLSNSAMLELRRGHADVAEPVLMQVLSARRRLFGDENVDTVASIINCVFLLQHQDRLSEAEPLAREALELSRRVHGAEHSGTLIAQNNLAMLLHQQGRMSEAEPYAREALALARRALGEEHPNTIAHLANLAIILQDQQRFDEAEPFYRESMEMAGRVLGKDHPNSIAFLFNVSNICRKLGRPVEAEAYSREVLERSTRVLGEDHPDTIWYMGDLAQLLIEQDRLTEAEPLVSSALEKARRTLGDHNSTVFHCVYRMGNLLRKQGKPDQAEPLFREAIAGYTKVLGPDRSYTAIAHTGLGDALLEQSRFEEAEKELLLAEPIFEAAEDTPLDNHRRCIELLVSLYERWEEAQPGEGHGARAAPWRSKLAEIK